MPSDSLEIAVIGAGYVGLTTAIVLAFLGHSVSIVEKNPEKLQKLSKGLVVIPENGLQELFDISKHRITITNSIKLIENVDIIILCLGTPSTLEGEVNANALELVTSEIAQKLKKNHSYTIIVKSTVQIGTSGRIFSIIKNNFRFSDKFLRVNIVSNPEFLRESFAVYDTLFPERIVIGAESEPGFEVIEKMYESVINRSFILPDILSSGIDTKSFSINSQVLNIPRRKPIVVRTDRTSAEMIKYAANAFLALKISFINEIAGLCEKIGADVLDVAKGIGSDSRIGSKFLQAGLGWGGSCFPKDLRALQSLGLEYNYPLLLTKAAETVNNLQKFHIFEKIQQRLKVPRGKVILVLGVSFKANTVDIRDSPSIGLIELLAARGSYVRVHDPEAINYVREIFVSSDISLHSNLEIAFEGADAVVIATDWDVYRTLDWESYCKSMSRPIIFDTRNLLAGVDLSHLDIEYVGVGR